MGDWCRRGPGRQNNAPPPLFARRRLHCRHRRRREVNCATGLPTRRYGITNLYLNLCLWYQRANRARVNYCRINSMAVKYLAGTLLYPRWHVSQICIFIFPLSANQADSRVIKRPSALPIYSLSFIQFSTKLSTSAIWLVFTKDCDCTGWYLCYHFLHSDIESNIRSLTSAPNKLSAKLRQSIQLSYCWHCLQTNGSSQHVLYLLDYYYPLLLENSELLKGLFSFCRI